MNHFHIYALRIGIIQSKMNESKSFVYNNTLSHLSVHALITYIIKSHEKVFVYSYCSYLHENR